MRASVAATVRRTSRQGVDWKRIRKVTGQSYTSFSHPQTASAILLQRKRNLRRLQDSRHAQNVVYPFRCVQRAAVKQSPRATIWKWLWRVVCRRDRMDPVVGKYFPRINADARQRPRRIKLMI